MDPLIQDYQSYFNQLVEEDKLVHAYHFTGDNFEAKREISRHILKALICPNYRPGQGPCNTCSYCQRADQDQLADVVYLRADGSQVKVDQIRQLKDWMLTSPVELPVKLAVIEEADLMNEAASNALLTFLEEPIGSVYIILYSLSRQDLLATIQSRTQALHFPQTDTASQVKQMTEAGMQEDHARLVAELSADSPDRFLEDYQADSFSLFIAGLNDYYGYLLARNPLAFVTVEAQLKKHLNQQAGLDACDYLLALNHQLIMSHYGYQQDSVLTPLAQALKKENQTSMSDLIKLNEELLKSKQRISANVSAQLVLERLAVVICQWK